MTKPSAARPDQANAFSRAAGRPRAARTEALRPSRTTVPWVYYDDRHAAQVAR